MSKKTTSLLSLFIFSIVFAQQSFAITVPQGQTPSAEIQKMQRQAKANFKIEKRIATYEKRLGHSLSFDNSVDKWLYIAIFGLLAGLLLAALGLNALAGIAGTIGFIALIVWIVKKV
jgi:Flp pilus assembly protein TadB